MHNYAHPSFSFNPSVGILGGQTLHRDRYDVAWKQVSIPQSGFLVVKPGIEDDRAKPWSVSIPQSGFLVVKQEPVSNSVAPQLSFNPSVGILGGQTTTFSPGRKPVTMFQSLSRDSWWSNQKILQRPQCHNQVSIPQSGFLVVKPIVSTSSMVTIGSVSIPQSGFLVVKPDW